MKQNLLVALFVIFVLCQCATARKHTLVLVDDLSVTESHSQFFKILTERGYELTFRTPNEDISFVQFGEFKYDSLIVFAPTTENWNENKISRNQILEFIDSGAGDVLIAGDSDVNYFVDQLAAKCGVNFGDSGSFVVDHFNYDKSDYDGDHSLIVVESNQDSGSKLSSILYQGNGMTFNPSNRLVFPILTGSSTAYLSSAERISDDPKAAGINLVLVAGLQARNNARVTVSGSLSLFSNKFLSAKVQKIGSDKLVPSNNAKFVDELTKWNFGEQGIIRIKSIEHHRVGETEQRSTYTINDELEYIVYIEEFNGKEWVGYSAPDVQLELRMLDPYIRTTLKPDGKGKFSAVFKAPDVYGVFTFNLEYHRVGYSSLSDRTLVTIRPYRHDEYERFISSAYPYYVSAFAMMGGVALFIGIFIFSKNE